MTTDRLKPAREATVGMVRVRVMEDDSIELGVKIPTKVGMVTYSTPYLDADDLIQALREAGVFDARTSVVEHHQV